MTIRLKRTRLSAAERREVIERAATEVFAERGYQAAGMEEIARRSGVTPPVLYDHFDSKRGLYAHLLERQAGELAARVASATAEVAGGKARLRAAFDAFFALVEEQPLLDGDRTVDEELRATARQRDAQAQAVLIEVLGGSSARLFADAPERQRALELTAQMLQGGLLALASWWREHPETPRAILVEHAMAIAWTGLRALRKNGRR
jgi:AcrR family transcriptional regulator